MKIEIRHHFNRLLIEIKGSIKIFLWPIVRKLQTTLGSDSDVDSKLRESHENERVLECVFRILFTIDRKNRSFK